MRSKRKTYSAEFKAKVDIKWNGKIMIHIVLEKYDSVGRLLS